VAVCVETCLLCTQMLQENRTICRQLAVPLYCSVEVQYMEPMCLWLQVCQHYSLWIFQLSEIWCRTLVYGYLCISYSCQTTTMKMRYKSPPNYWYLCCNLHDNIFKKSMKWFVRPTWCYNYDLLINQKLNMFQAPLCPSSGMQGCTLLHMVFGT